MALNKADLLPRVNGGKPGWLDLHSPNPPRRAVLTSALEGDGIDEPLSAIDDCLESSVAGVVVV